MKDNLFDVDTIHFLSVKEILKQHAPNKKVWAYGSRVTGGADSRSDLDIVIFDSGLSQINELKDAFAESDLPFSVDVMDWGKIPENFRDNILKKYLVLQE